MATDSNFRVGLVQMSCGLDPAPLDKAAYRVREAAREGAQVVCLPDLFRQYFCQREDIALFESGRSDPRAPEATETAEEPFTTRGRGRLWWRLHSLSSERAPRAALSQGTPPRFSKRMAEWRGSTEKMHIPDDPLYYEKCLGFTAERGFGFSLRLIPPVKDR